MKTITVNFEKVNSYNSNFPNFEFPLAATQEERIKGLSGQTEMKQMAFYFNLEEEEEGRQNKEFIMPDMKFDLDLIFIDDLFTIRQISRLYANEPDAYALAPINTQYVLEVQCGFVERNSIYVGQKVYLKL